MCILYLIMQMNTLLKESLVVKKRQKKHILFLNEAEYNDVNDYIIEKCQVF